MKSGRSGGMCGVVVLGGLLFGAQMAAAQKVTPVPKLDLNQITGVWHDVAHLPSKSLKACKDEPTVLYALGYKKNSFQMGTFCQGKHDVAEEHDVEGKLDKSGAGILKVSRFVIFSTKNYVMATGPSFDWILIGTRNHKSLSVLSRSPMMPADTLDAIETKAAAEGFKTAKLITAPPPPKVVTPNVVAGTPESH